MFRRVRSNIFLLTGSPGDKYLWSFILLGIPCYLNTALRNGDSTKPGFLLWHYQNFYNYFNGNHFMIYVLGHVIVTFVTYGTLGAIYTFIDVIKKPEFLTRFKVYPDKTLSSTNPSFSQCVQLVFLNLCLTLPFSIANFFVMSKFGKMNFRPDQFPSHLTLTFDLFINSTVLEICFYYSHRIMHHPFIYKHIHKMHHEFVSPIAISFFYAHPIEHVFGVLIPFTLGMHGRHVHVLSSFMWVSLSIYIGMAEHSGYHFPILASTEFHHYHHARFNQNFGLTGFMDSLHETSRDFSKSIFRKRHFSFFGGTPLIVAIPDKPKEIKQT